ncbi:MAG: protein-glutamate O-methyltransferase family protein [Treponema sp.]|nr:protein-glutamate O-methyltransferase family protein [Treponema sp.]
METDDKQANYFFIGKDEVQDLGKESFAHFTARTRFRKIFSEHCSGDYEKDFLEKTIWTALELEKFDESSAFGLFSVDGLSKFLAQVNAKILHPHGKISYLKKKKEKKSNTTLKWTNTLKDFFNHAPFFESEILFYHVLLAQKEYFLNRYDFFATEKKDSLENSRDKFIANLNDLFSDKTKDGFDLQTFRTCIRYCLSANTSDLSQLNAKERFDYEIGDIQILHDDTTNLYEYVSAGKKFKRFDIICDNAGKELFSDLYLALYFLSNNIVDKIVFHLKPYPFFVSDATKEDFGFMMNAIMKYGGIQCATQCNKYIHEGKIEIEDDTFWAAPLCFKEMPKNKLHEQLCNSDLIIVKGDLNYRRLVEDRNWKYTDSFSKRTKGVFGKVPIFAPRVLKSDVLVGISDAAYHTAKSSDKLDAPADQRFRGSGKWAVIHFRCNKYKHYKKEVQETRKDDNFGTFGEKRSGNSTNDKKNKLSNEKDSASSKSFGNIHRHLNADFSIKFLCGISLFLIFLMMLVTTIPIISESISQIKGKVALQQNNTNNEIATQQNNINNGENAVGAKPSNIDFTLLLAGYGIFMAGTLILPRYLLKEKTHEEVSKQLDKKLPDKIKMEVQQQTENKLQKLQEIEHKLDGDLSRMIAFLLMKNEMPVWSIGWGFHAMKRYISLERTCRKNEHILFLDLLRQTIFKKSISLFCKYITEELSFKERQKEVDSVFKAYHLQDAHCSNFTKAICYEALHSDETQPEMPVLRAVKDIIDVEFIVKNNIYGWDEQSEFLQKCRDISLFIGAFARFIIFNFIFFPFDDQSKRKRSIFSKEELVDNIVKISSLKSEPHLFKQYKLDLKKTIDHIYMNGLNISCKNKVRMHDSEELLVSIYNDENSFDNKKKDFLFFFANEESSYPKE